MLLNLKKDGGKSNVKIDIHNQLNKPRFSSLYLEE
jgi:hypothetical protein